MGPTRHLLSKPVIAAVEGHAVAGGLELALWCDLRVASESAKFGVFCRRWGVPLIDGGTVRLPFGLDSAARGADFAAAGLVADPAEVIRWTLRLDAHAMRRLYATYSNVIALPPEARKRLLDGLVEVAEQQFGGAVERNMATAIHIARAPA